MKNNFIIVWTFVLSIIFSKNLLCVHFIFTCIDNSDLACLEREASIDLNWQYERNLLNETPLQMAIRLKNNPIIKALVKAQAIVSRDDVIFAMKEYFNVDQKYFSKIYNDAGELEVSANIQKPTLCEKMIIALASDPDMEDKLEKFAKVIDLFCSRVELSRHIRDLKISRRISDYPVKKLLYYYRDVFLQDTHLSGRSLKIIVKNLLFVDVEKFLLQLIIDTYEQKSQAKPQLAYVNTSKSNSRKSHREDLVYAIIEQSRSHYLELTPKRIVRNVFTKPKGNLVNRIFDYQNRLANFVEKSIMFPIRKRQVIENYRTWTRVYQRLIEMGDFSSAFCVATGMNQSVISKRIKGKSADLLLVDTTKSFRNYRTMLANNSSGLSIPSLVIVQRDLVTIAELGLFKGNYLSAKALDYFIRFRTEYSQVRKTLFNKRYAASPNLVDIFRNLPDAGEKTSSKKWHKAYRLVMGML